MNQNLFEKARKLLNQGNIIFEGRGNWFEFWKIDDTSLRIEVNAGTKIHCTCKHCSVYGGKYLCSNKIALIGKKLRMVKI